MSASWALGKVGADWRCGACGARNTSDDFFCTSCGRVISVDDLLAILRDAGEAGASYSPTASSSTPRRPRTPTPRPTSRPTPRPAPKPTPRYTYASTTTTPARRPRTTTDIVLGSIGIVIILALVALLILGTIALVSFLSEPANAGDPASGAAAVVTVPYDVPGGAGGA